MTDLTIERLGHRGDGIAPGPVFVPRTLPGEVVSGEVKDGRIRTAKIITPSPERVRPPCRHYKACGGCALQHASDRFVADWKVEIVRNALKARGLEVPIDDVFTSPPRSRRRAVLSGRRLKNGALVGFHAPQAETLVRIPDCKLLTREIVEALPILEEMVTVGATRKGTLRLTVTASESGLDISAEGGKPLDLDLRQGLSGFASRGIARLVWEGEPVFQSAPPFQRFGRARVVPPPGAFLQATLAGEAALQREVRQGLAGAASVIDLFAGSGTFSLPLAEWAEVRAVEGEDAAMRALDAGWRRAEGLRRVEVETRDLFRQPVLRDELARFEAVCIDPPRAGAEAQTREIAQTGIDRVVAISCNPVTFARDASILVDAGFRIARLVVVDQFRWSTHVELAAHFQRG